MIDVETILGEELETLRLDLVGRMQAANLIATGRTARSLRWAASGGKGELRGAAWFGTLEKGRGPWRGGRENPQFLKNLTDWIRARGMQFRTEQELIRFAKYLKWKINKSGSRLYRLGGRKDIYTPAFNLFADRLRQRVAGQIKIDVRL